MVVQARETLAGLPGGAAPHLDSPVLSRILKRYARIRAGWWNLMPSGPIAKSGRPRSQAWGWCSATGKSPTCSGEDSQISVQPAEEDDDRPSLAGYRGGSLDDSVAGVRLKSRSSVFVAIAIASASVLGLAGCSSVVHGAISKMASQYHANSKAHASETSTPTPSPAVPLPIGTVVSGTTKPGPGQAIYVTTGGQFIVVDKDQPLPADVMNDILAYAQSPAALIHGGGMNGYSALSAAGSTGLEQLISSTGKTPCIVLHDYAGASATLGWFAVNPGNPPNVRPTEAEAEADCTALNPGVPQNELGILAIDLAG